MDNNQKEQTGVTSQPSSNPVSQPAVSTPQASEPAPVNNQKSGRKLLLALVLILILAAVAAGGYLYYLSTKSSKLVARSITQAQPTPTPSVYQINPNNTSNQALSQDSQALNQSINKASQNFNSVDQSFNDQQTNLQ